MAGTPSFLLVAFSLLLLASSAHAFGAGHVERGSHLLGYSYRHGDITQIVTFLATNDPLFTQKVYFGNWLRDFSQLLDKRSLELVPEAVLRAIVQVFGFVQFGYSTREFEVTKERLGTYRPEEHIDNPKGYDGGRGLIDDRLRGPVADFELDIDPQTGMKNYIANVESNQYSTTSAYYVKRQLTAAVVKARKGDPEAYNHLGAALHTLEDFVAHSNWLEICLEMVGAVEQAGTKERLKSIVGLGGVFPFVGDAARIRTARGLAPPLVIGTFGALDLYQSLLGELDDKITAMTIPGLRTRTQLGDDSPIGDIAKGLVSTIGAAKPDGVKSNPFEKNILKIVKSISGSKPRDFKALNENPGALWDSIEPVLKLRDDIVKWVYEHLTWEPIRDACATISVAVEKLVYYVLGVFLRPVLQDIEKVLINQSHALAAEDEASRLAKGESSVFDSASRATDPTHSMLSKDHYAHELNELSGRVSTTIALHAFENITAIWHPGDTSETGPIIDSILETLHHPYNYRQDSPLQAAMVAQVVNYVEEQNHYNPQRFAEKIRRLGKRHVSDLVAFPHSHGHGSAVPAVSGASATGHAPPGHDAVTSEPRSPFRQQIANNLARQRDEGMLSKMTPEAFKRLESTLFSDASADTPNPIDAALSTKGIGASSLEASMGDIRLSEIGAAEGMGNTLKEGVVRMIRANKQNQDRMFRERARAFEMLGVSMSVDPQGGLQRQQTYAEALLNRQGRRDPRFEEAEEFSRDERREKGLDGDWYDTSAGGGDKEAMGTKEKLVGKMEKLNPFKSSDK